MDKSRPIALAADDQFFLSRLLLGAPCDATPEQATRLFNEGLIERCGKRWILSAAGRELLIGDAREDSRQIMPPRPGLHVKTLPRRVALHSPA